MALPATDIFNNTGASPVALTTYSGSWTYSTGTAVVDNAADNVYPTTSGNEFGAFWNADTFGADQYAQATLSTLTSGVAVGVAVRAATGGTYYGCYFEGTTYYLFRVNAGTWTQLATGTQAWTDGDTLRLEVSGTSPCALVMKRNGTQFGSTYNDSDAARITSGAAGISAYGDNTTPRIDNWEGSNLGAAASFEQEGFRFGADDGSESAHTWLDAQDTNITAALSTNILLRAIVNATNDPAATAYTLRYKRSDEGTYAAVPIGSTTSPTLSYGATSTSAYSTAGGSSVAPAYPSGITANSGLILVVGQKPSAANSGSVTTPSGWTLRTSKTGATDGDTGGYTTTLGADTGNTNIYVYTKDTVTGSETGTLAVTVGTNDVCWATIIRLEASASCTWSWAASVGKDTSAGSVSFATDAGVAIASGDMVIGGMVIPTDVTTPAQFSAESFTQTGSTFGSASEIEEPDSGTGNDIGGFLCYAAVSSGSGSGAVTLAATAGGTTTNVRGPGFVLRARVTGVANRVYIAPSANITAGGEATTARLSAPSGKTTADFVTGRRWDDENGTDTIDITTDDYTEVEWCLQAQSPATNGEAYQFRVYAGASALDTYTVTPQWTIGSGSSITSVQVARGRTLSRGLGRGLQ